MYGIFSLGAIEYTTDSNVIRENAVSLSMVNLIQNL